MLCPSCNKEVEPGVAFCTYCGARLPDLHAEPQATRTAPPMEVALVSIYTAAGSVVTIVGATFLLAAGGAVSGLVSLLSQSPGQWEEISRQLGQLSSVLFTGELMYLLSILGLGASYGLWARVRWGHTLASAVYAIYVIASLLSLGWVGAKYAVGTFGQFATFLVNIGIAIGILVWLNQPTTKRLFGK
jgi:hypothetical protein